MCETYTHAYLQCTCRKRNRTTHPKPYSEISSELHLRNVHVHEMSSTQHVYAHLIMLDTTPSHMHTVRVYISEKLIS